MSNVNNRLSQLAHEALLARTWRDRLKYCLSLYLSWYAVMILIRKYAIFSLEHLSNNAIV